MNQTVTIYDAEKIGDITEVENAELALFSAEQLLSFTNAIIWTTRENIGEEPTSVVINTKAARYTFLRPRLIYVSNHLLVLSALSDHAASGTMQKIQKYYIAIEQK